MPTPPGDLHTNMKNMQKQMETLSGVQKFYLI